MLAHAKLRHFPSEDYVNPDHPLQQLIASSFAEICNLDVKDLITGIDGCSAPNFAVPLANFALALARLVDPGELPGARSEACSRITQAMTSQPEMISGPGRFDTILMQLGKGKIVAKAGAEGYQAIGLAKNTLGKGSPAIGIALKIAGGDGADYQAKMHRQFDGDEAYHLTRLDTSERARPCAAVELLRQLGALNEDSLQQLAHFAARPIYNWRKVIVGDIKATFKVTL
jgi:L-asparaginase II